MVHNIKILYSYDVNDKHIKKSLLSLLSFNIQSIKNYNSITKLNYTRNGLTSLPKLPQRLICLNCGYNILTYLPELPQTLTEVYCHNNKIINLSELPQTLIILYCQYNNLTYLSELPKTLTNLLCHFNKLIYLSELPQTLITLYCQYNNLTYLSELPQTLFMLYCSNNNILIFPYIHNFSNINIRISNNNIKYMDIRYHLIPISHKQLKLLTRLIKKESCSHVICY